MIYERPTFYKIAAAETTAMRFFAKIERVGDKSFDSRAIRIQN